MDALPGQGELVPDGMSRRELRAEACRRAHRAGYPVTADGRPKPPAIQATVNFGVRRYNLWPRDAAGRLIE